LTGQLTLSMILEGRSFSIRHQRRPRGRRLVRSCGLDLYCFVFLPPQRRSRGREEDESSESQHPLSGILLFGHQRRPYGLRIGRSCEFGLCCFAFLLSPSATPHGTGRLVRSRRSRPASFEDLGKCPAGRVASGLPAPWVPAALAGAAFFAYFSFAAERK